MATGKITKRSVDELTRGTREEFLWDTDLRGFGVKVSKRGTRTYVFQYRMGGREAPTRRYTIGVHGSPWTPATAREEAERLSLNVAQGVDPNAAELERRRLAVDLAFDAYADRFRISCGDSGWGRMVARTLRLHLTPHFRRKPLNTITRANISAVLDTIPPEKIALKRNTFAVIRRLFRWAVNRGDIANSPRDGMATPEAVVPRDRVLSDAELTRVWNGAAKAGKLFGPIVRLLIATGQRREEVSALDWSEIDQRNLVWTLPKERAKNGIAHLIPLNECAVEILSGVSGGKKEWPRTGLIFATAGGKRYIAHSKGKQQLDKAIVADGGSDIPAWRLHDLRRTLATGFQKLGVRFEVTEAVLNHLSGAKAGVAGTYQRHDWSVEKRQALDLWAKRIRSITSGVDDHATSAPSDFEKVFLAGVELGLRVGRMSPNAVGLAE